MQSYNNQPFHSGPYFFGFSSLFPKNNESDCSDKKRLHEVRELKVHTTGKGESLAQLTLGQLLSGRARMRAKAGNTAKALGDLSAGTHALCMNRRAHSILQALNLLSTTFL